MNCDNYKDKIILYIENELSEIERIDFEKQLKINSDLSQSFNELKNTMNSLKKLPKIEASSDFIIKLNNKIDKYESNKLSSLYKRIFSVKNNVLKLSYATLAIALIFSLGYFINDFNIKSNLILSNTSELDMKNEVADIDSLVVE